MVGSGNVKTMSDKIDNKKLEKEENQMQSKDLLLADLHHFGESLWRNEEVGEKRFSFFITLITALLGASVALVKTDKLPEEFMITILWGLIIFGFLTYLRMVQRNRVTDEYQRTLKYIRKQCISLCPDLASYKVPRHNKKWWLKWIKGGYAETIGTINSMLIGALIFHYSKNIVIAIIVGLLFCTLQWLYACIRNKKGDNEKS